MNTIKRKLSTLLNTNQNFIIYMHADEEGNVQMEYFDKNPSSINISMGNNKLSKLEGSLQRLLKSKGHAFLIKSNNLLSLKDSLVMDKSVGNNYPICIKNSSIYYFDSKKLGYDEYVKHLIRRASFSTLFRKGVKIGKHLCDVENINIKELKKLMSYFGNSKRLDSNLPMHLDDYFYNLGLAFGFSGAFSKKTLLNIRNGIWTNILFNKSKIVDTNLKKCEFTSFLFKNFKNLKRLDFCQDEIKGIYLNSLVKDFPENSIENLYAHFTEISKDMNWPDSSTMISNAFDCNEICNRSDEFRKLIVLDSEFIQGNHGSSYLASLGYVSCRLNDFELEIEREGYELSSDMKYLPESERWRLKRFTKLTNLTGYEYRSVKRDESLFENLLSCCTSEEDSLFVTWGNNDETVIVSAEERLNTPILGLSQYIWLNLLEEFKKFYGFKNDVSIKNAIIFLSLDLDLNYHHALDDAIATYEIMKKMISDGWRDDRLYKGYFASFLHGKMKKSKSEKKSFHSNKNCMTVKIEVEDIDILIDSLLKSSYLLLNNQKFDRSTRNLGFNILFNQYLDLNYRKHFENCPSTLELKIPYECYFFYPAIKLLSSNDIDLQKSILDGICISKSKKSYIHGIIHNSMKHITIK